MQRSFCISPKFLIIGEIQKEERLKKQPENAERRKGGLLKYHLRALFLENRATSKQTRVSESTAVILAGKKPNHKH